MAVSGAIFCTCVDDSVSRRAPSTAVPSLRTSTELSVAVRKNLTVDHGSHCPSNPGDGMCRVRAVQGVSETTRPAVNPIPFRTARSWDRTGEVGSQPALLLNDIRCGSDCVDQGEQRRAIEQEAAREATRYRDHNHHPPRDYKSKHCSRHHDTTSSCLLLAP